MSFTRPTRQRLNEVSMLSGFAELSAEVGTKNNKKYKKRRNNNTGHFMHCNDRCACELSDCIPDPVFQSVVRFLVGENLTWINAVSLPQAVLSKTFFSLILSLLRCNYLVNIRHQNNTLCEQ